uniref:Peroxisome proliferator-activated receptor gamma coactivator 1-alpha n=1 Tax=Oryzias sinensis TaxID=183150 RepID=A0A8C7Z1F3_9TELE
MAWDRCNQDSVWTELECAALVGEDQPLCPDLPELDLSELDVSDLDADSFLGGLKWYSDQSEIVSTQYGNEASNLFELKKLLLAPANSQLSYNQYTGGKAQNHAASSNHRIRPPPAVVKTESPWNGKARGGSSQQNRPVRRPCTELLKYLTATDDILLHTKGSEPKSAWGGASSKDKSGLGLGASSSSSSPSSSSTSSFSSLSSISSSSSTTTTKKKSALPSQQPLQQHHQRAKPTTLPLPLTPESPNDYKGSPFENKTIERTLSVEIAGTPGLTPPTTPPHKASQENPFKASLKTKLSSCSSSALTCKRSRLSELGACVVALAPGASAGGPARKGPEQTELYAQLSKASTALPYTIAPYAVGGGLEEHRSPGNNKRACPRGHSDHDYCQASARSKAAGGTATVTTVEMTFTPRAADASMPSSGKVENGRLECKDSAMPAPFSPPSFSPSSASPGPLTKEQTPVSLEAEAGHCRGSGEQTLTQASPIPAFGAASTRDQPQLCATSRKPLCDQEIRAELNKHFGHHPQAVHSQGGQEKEANCKRNKATAPQPAVAGENDYYSQKLLGSSYLHTGFLPFHDEIELGEGRDSRFVYPWEGTPLDLLFDCSPSSPSCSPPSSCSPSRGSLSPPSSLLLSPNRPFCWTTSGSRSRSHSGSRSSSSRYRRRSLSSSPDRRPPSWSRHSTDLNVSRSRTHKSPRPQSRSPLSRRPRYDSYEEYQHERLKREEYRLDYEKREFERAEQREKQRQKAIEERRVVYVGRLRSDCTRTELKRRFEVFGEIEECAVNLRDDGDNFGFITYRYTCDAYAALENGHTLRRPNDPQFELCFGGQRQFCKSHYTDLDSHTDDFDPASTKSKYDSMDFDSLLREAQCSLRR